MGSVGSVVGRLMSGVWGVGGRECVEDNTGRVCGKDCVREYSGECGGEIDVGGVGSGW